MVQVRDNGGVCQLAVPLGVFALAAARSGNHNNSATEFKTPGCTPPCAATVRAFNTIRRPKIAPGLMLINTKSRQITVNDASFSRVAHHPTAETDQFNQDDWSGAAGQFRQRNWPKVAVATASNGVERHSQSRCGVARRVAAAAASNRSESHPIAVNRTELKSMFTDFRDLGRAGNGGNSCLIVPNRVIRIKRGDRPTFPEVQACQSEISR